MRGRGGVEERVGKARVVEGRTKERKTVEWGEYIIRLLSTVLSEAMDLSRGPESTRRAHRFREGEGFLAIHLLWEFSSVDVATQQNCHHHDLFHPLVVTV